MNKIMKLATFLVLIAALGFGQSAPRTTTLSTAIPAGGTNQLQVCLASATGVVLPSVTSGVAGSILLIDKEAFLVRTQGASSTCYNVNRGYLGTSAQYGHSANRTVYVGAAAVGSGDPSRPFTNGIYIQNIPSGSCTASQQSYLPVILIDRGNTLATGTQYNCVAGQWVAGNPQLQPASTSPPNYSMFTTLSVPNAIATASVTDVNGTIWFSQVSIPYNSTLTGACVLNGATVGTDKWIVALYDSTGALVANSATAGTTTATASKYQCIAFTAQVNVVGPQTYYLALQGNGTTDNFQSYAANGAPTNYGTNSQTGTFGTLASITPTVTFTANKGPLMMTY